MNATLDTARAAVEHCDAELEEAKADERAAADELATAQHRARNRSPDAPAMLRRTREVHDLAVLTREGAEERLVAAEVEAAQVEHAESCARFDVALEAADRPQLFSTCAEDIAALAVVRRWVLERQPTPPSLYASEPPPKLVEVDELPGALEQPSVEVHARELERFVATELEGGRVLRDLHAAVESQNEAVRTACDLARELGRPLPRVREVRLDELMALVALAGAQVVDRMYVIAWAQRFGIDLGHEIRTRVNVPDLRDLAALTITLGDSYLALLRLQPPMATPEWVDPRQRGATEFTTGLQTFPGLPGTDPRSGAR